MTTQKSIGLERGRGGTAGSQEWTSQVHDEEKRMQPIAAGRCCHRADLRGRGDAGERHLELAGPEPLPLDELHLHECRPIVHSNAFGLLCFDLLVTGRINDRAPARSYRRVSQRHMTCGPYLGTFGDDHLHSFLFGFWLRFAHPRSIERVRA